MKEPNPAYLYLTETQKAYWACFLDSEGSISVTRGGYTSRPKTKPPKRYYYAVIRIQLNNTNGSLIEQARKELGGYKSVSPGHRNGYQRIDRKDSRCRDVWKTTIESRQARAVLRALLPYLRLKRRQALLALMLEPAEPGQVPGRDEKIFRNTAMALCKYMNENSADYIVPMEIALGVQPEVTAA